MFKEQNCLAGATQLESIGTPPDIPNSVFKINDHNEKDLVFLRPA